MKSMIRLHYTNFIPKFFFLFLSSSLQVNLETNNNQDKQTKNLVPIQIPGTSKNINVK